MLRQFAKRAAAPSTSCLASSSTLIASSSRSGSSSLTSIAANRRRSSKPLSTSAIKRKNTSSSSSSSTWTSTSSSPPPIPSASSSAPLLQVSTLPNGVRVATDGTPGHFVAAGVYVGAGSRFEWEGNSGSSHMMDRLAFKVGPCMCAEAIIDSSFLTVNERENSGTDDSRYRSAGRAIYRFIL